VRILLAHLLKWQGPAQAALPQLGSDHRRAARSDRSPPGGEPEPAAGSGGRGTERLFTGGSVGGDRDRAVAPSLPRRAIYDQRSILSDEDEPGRA
jgi:hypothetical protein